MSKKKLSAADDNSSLQNQNTQINQPRNLNASIPSAFVEQDYLLAASSLDNSIADGEKRFQQHQQDAELLLAAYRNGDEDAVALFKERHPEANKADFQPTLVDARLLVSRDRFHLHKLSLDRLKREAKNLLKLIKAGKEEGIARLQTHHPKWQQLQQIKLADAQWIVARELGLPSWPRLKHHLQALTEAENQLESKGILIDDDPHTLHIRCGTDIQQALAACKIKGKFVEIIDPFPQGRVPPSDPIEEFASIRAQFVDLAYSRLNKEDVSAESTPLFTAEEQFLRSLPKNYRRICLWYEHDCFDQLSLAYVLHHLARVDLTDVKIELVQVNQFPGLDRFVGIGQLSQNPATLALLWQNRMSVTPNMMAFAAECWTAFTAGTPLDIWNKAIQANTPLPTLQSALLRLLQELPWVSDGLSLTERLTLQIVARDGAMKPARAFHFLMAEAEPQAYLGDIMFLHVVLELAKANKPALILEKLDIEAGPLQQERMVLTETGQALLNGEIHFRDCGPQARWLGNTEVYATTNYKLAKNWYWSAEGGAVLFS